jgi:hypothetical protein
MVTTPPRVRISSTTRRVLAMVAAVALLKPTSAAAQGTWHGPDSTLVAAIHALVELHHPSVLSADARDAVVWIVTDAQYNYRWSTVDARATPTSILSRAQHAELSDALARLRLAEHDSAPDRDGVAAARANLARIVRNLKRYATLADVSRVDVTALADFLAP